MRKLACLCLAAALCLLALPSFAEAPAVPTADVPAAAPPVAVDDLFAAGSCDAPVATPEPVAVESVPEPLFLGGGATPCGDVFCGKGQWCCNASCNRCAPIGVYCTQEACV